VQEEERKIARKMIESEQIEARIALEKEREKGDFINTIDFKI
jgi:hypothetical protein